MSGTEKTGHHAFLEWVRLNWQVLVGVAGILTAVDTFVENRSSNNTKIDDRLTHIEGGITHGEQRDLENMTTLNREITELSRRLDTRITDLSNNVSTSINELSKHSDERENFISAQISKSVTDLTNRSDAAEHMALDLRHLRDVEQGAMRERIAKLEAQIIFFAERLDVSQKTPPPPLPVPVPLKGHRR